MGQLSTMWDSGRLTADSRYWMEGRDEWAPVREIFEPWVEGQDEWEPDRDTFEPQRQSPPRASKTPSAAQIPRSSTASKGTTKSNGLPAQQYTPKRTAEFYRDPSAYGGKPESNKTSALAITGMVIALINGVSVGVFCLFTLVASFSIGGAEGFGLAILTVIYLWISAINFWSADFLWKTRKRSAFGTKTRIRFNKMSLVVEVFYGLKVLFLAASGLLVFFDASAPIQIRLFGFVFAVVWAALQAAIAHRFHKVGHVYQ